MSPIVPFILLPLVFLWLAFILSRGYRAKLLLLFLVWLALRRMK